MNVHCSRQYSPIDWMRNINANYRLCNYLHLLNADCENVHCTFWFVVTWHVRIFDGLFQPDRTGFTVHSAHLFQFPIDLDIILRRRRKCHSILLANQLHVCASADTTLCRHSHSLHVEMHFSRVYHDLLLFEFRMWTRQGLSLSFSIFLERTLNDWCERSS